MSDLRNDMLVLVSDLGRLIRTEADKRVRALGLSRAQWVILARVQRTPGLSQRELAEILDVEPITVARLVDRLAARDWVERRPDGADRRIWRLHLLPAAIPVLLELEPHRAAIQQLLLEGVDDAALATTLAALERMRANMGACRRGEAAETKAAQSTAAGAAAATRVRPHLVTVTNTKERG